MFNYRQVFLHKHAQTVHLTSYYHAHEQRLRTTTLVALEVYLRCTSFCLHGRLGEASTVKRRIEVVPAVRHTAQTARCLLNPPRLQPDSEEQKEEKAKPTSKSPKTEKTNDPLWEKACLEPLVS